MSANGASRMSANGASRTSANGTIRMSANGAIHASPGQRPGSAAKRIQALKGRPKPRHSVHQR
jgi:hypothetical protein